MEDTKRLFTWYKIEYAKRGDNPHTSCHTAEMPVASEDSVTEAFYRKFDRLEWRLYVVQEGD